MLKRFLDALLRRGPRDWAADEPVAELSELARRRAPSIDAPAPRVPNVTFDGPAEDPPEERATTPAVTEDGLPSVDDVFTAIEYIDSKGAASRRRITMRKFVPGAGDSVSLMAHCHERRTVRTFRLDRIRCFIDQDGVITEPMAFWREIDVDTEALQNAGYRGYVAVSGAKPPKAGVAQRAVARHQLRILGAIARADRDFHTEEVAAILEYLCEECDAAGIVYTEEDLSALRSYIRRLRPTREKVEESLSALFGEDQNALDAAGTRRFFRGVRAVIDADGVLAVEEVEFAERLNALRR